LLLVKIIQEPEEIKNTEQISELKYKPVYFVQLVWRQDREIYKIRSSLYEESLFMDRTHLANTDEVKIGRLGAVRRI